VTLRLLALFLVLTAAFGALAARDASSFGAAIDAALRRADERDGIVLVQFLAADRPLCARMEEETLASASVRDELAHGWEIVRIDASREPELFRRLLGENGALASVALTSRGESMAAWRGFATAPEFAGFLEDMRARAPEIRAAYRRAEGEHASAAELVVLGEMLTRASLPALARERFERAMQREPADRDARLRAALGLAELALERGENLAVREALATVRALSPEPCGEALSRIAALEAGLAVLERRAVPAPDPTSSTH
jgi:hypothetical protein